MHGFVTTSCPAGALRQRGRVVVSANQKLAALHLLEMALHAEIRIAHGQQFRVDGTMRAVAGGAALVHRLVFKHVRAALGGMALEAVIILRPEGGADLRLEGFSPSAVIV